MDEYRLASRHHGVIARGQHGQHKVHHADIGTNAHDK